jgi:general secretion pathway protein H
MKFIEAKAALRGFTLLELIVVVAIIAMASASVTLAMRDTSQILLERDAQRLTVLLESARAQSRATGMVVRWQPTATGFAFSGLATGGLPTKWLSESTRPVGDVTLFLGPEAMIGAQAFELTDTSQRGSAQAQNVRIATDGLRPFSIRPLPLQAKNTP